MSACAKTQNPKVLSLYGSFVAKFVAFYSYLSLSVLVGQSLTYYDELIAQLSLDLAVELFSSSIPNEIVHDLLMAVGTLVSSQCGFLILKLSRKRGLKTVAKGLV